MDEIPLQTQNTVKTINIHNHMQRDYWYWMPDKNGQFNSKSAWNHIRTKHNELNWIDDIWDFKCAPKMSICGPLEKLNKLHTKDRVSKWNSAIDKCCVLYNNQIKDKDHLFFNCPYSKNLLEETMNKIDPNYGNSVDFN